MVVLFQFHQITWLGSFIMEILDKMIFQQLIVISHITDIIQDL